MTFQILVPLDDSPQSMAAVNHAVAHYPGADITILTVIEYTEKKTSLTRGGRGRDEGWYAAEREAAEALLDEATDIAADHDGDVSTVVKDGSPSSEILDYVTDYNIDIVVMGFRKRSPTGKALFGSTAQDVLLSVECPVVTVPNPES
ncbi:nucleotide-binding universal stress UspA family protein [Natrinema hispanicum]|uniref:Nucleotide-binding universal stress UspA family protein n=1 Tax=Natrinema hispanicum TaxID=392421 RepID=A0A482Y6E5_9EURY|nr:universal stress protein [Natrinema hispanicum]RZV06154.1 nucleotide-binding universal stress UspA family protein [Natrinema hispanicum]